MLTKTIHIALKYHNKINIKHFDIITTNNQKSN